MRNATTNTVRNTVTFIGRIWFRSDTQCLAVMRGRRIHATLLDDWEARIPTPTHTLTIATDGSTLQ